MTSELTTEQIQHYLLRIGFTGPHEPSLLTLAQLQKCHLLTVPFENLDIHYSLPISLEIQKIYRKIVLLNRGGFCYELNILFYHLLIALGFMAKIISARVFNSREQTYGPEYDHMAIIVSLGSCEYLVDVGFGEFSFAPILIEYDRLQIDERGEFVVKKYDDQYLQIAKKSEAGYLPEYIFTTIPRQIHEFTGMCLYHQQSPESHFTQKRLISLPTEKGRMTISGELLKITDGTKEVLSYTLKNESEFIEYLRRYFSIREINRC